MNSKSKIRLTLTAMFVFFASYVSAGDVLVNITNGDLGGPQDCAGGPGAPDPLGPTPPLPNDHAGNPISVAFGNKSHMEHVFSSGGEFPLEYKLSYNSHYKTGDSIMGIWRSNYSQKLFFPTSSFESDPSTELNLYNEFGQLIVFKGSRSSFTGDWQSSTRADDSSGRLRVTGSGASSVFKYYKPSGYIEEYKFKEYKGNDSFFELSAIESPFGLRHEITRERILVESPMIKECPYVHTNSGPIMVSFTQSSDSSGTTYFSSNFNSSNDKCFIVTKAVYEVTTRIADSFGNELKLVGKEAEGLQEPCLGCVDELYFNDELKYEFLISTPMYAFPGTTIKVKSVTRIEGENKYTREFLYEKSSSNTSGGCTLWNCQSALTGIIDEEGHRTATWNYKVANNIGTGGWPVAFSSYHGTGDEITDKTTIDFVDGHKRTVTNQYGRQRTYDFNKLAGIVTLTSVTSAGGTGCLEGAANYYYTGSGQLDYVVYDSGTDAEKRYDYDYYTDGRVKSITEDINTQQERKVVYTWENNLTYWLDKIDFYDSDGLYKTVDYEYETNNRLKSVEYIDQTSFSSYHYKNGKNLKWSFLYNYHDAEQTKVSSIVVDGPRPESDFVWYVYSAEGHLTKIGSMNMDYKFSEFNEYGRPKFVKDRDDNLLVQMEYREDKPISYVSGNHNIFWYFYNNGKLKKLWFSSDSQNDQSLEYQYTSAGEVKKITNLAGEVIDIDRSVATFDDSLREYDIKVSSFGASGNKYTTYNSKHYNDALGRLREWVGAEDDNYSVVYEYDQSSQVTSINNYSMTKTQFDYSADDGSIIKTRPDYKSETYTYSVEGLITSVTDARGLTTTYKRDGLGRLLELQSPDTGRHMYRYDGAGNVVGEADARDVSLVWEFDEASRLKKSNINYFITDFKYDTYDEYGFDAVYGKLTSAINTDATITMLYDEQQNLAGKIVNFKDGDGGFIRESRMKYKANGQIKEITYPSGRVIKYEHFYDQSNGSGNGVYLKMGANEALIASSTFNNFGKPTNVVMYDIANSSAAKSYNYWTTYFSGQINQDQLYVFDSGISETREHHYNNEGFLEKISNPNSDTDRMFDYFMNGELSNDIWVDDQTETVVNGNFFGYDSGGNRTAELFLDYSVSPVLVDFRAQLDYKTDSNRIDKLASTQEKFVYYSNGATKYDPNSRNNYKYQKNDRLSEVSNGNYISYYTYSPAGDRTSKKVLNRNTGAVLEWTFFYYDIYGRLLTEFNANGTVLREYIYIGNKLIAITEGATNKLYYVKTDYLNTPEAVYDTADGKLLWKVTHQPYGYAGVNEDPDGNGQPFKFNIRYPGQYYDWESGLHYNYFRYYDPRLGRYITSDPIGQAGGINTYAYAAGNPVNYIDPFGLEVDFNFHNPWCNSRMRYQLNPNCGEWGEGGYMQSQAYENENCISVSAHGNREKMVDKSSGYDETIDIPQLSQDIKGHPKYDPKGNNCIVLLSCNAGTGENPPANQLKDLLQPSDTVYGNDDFVYMDDKGNVNPSVDEFRKF